MEQLLFGLIIYSGKKKGCGGHVYLLQWAPCKLPTEFKLKKRHLLSVEVYSQSSWHPETIVYELLLLFLFIVLCLVYDSLESSIGLCFVDVVCRHCGESFSVW